MIHGEEPVEVGGGGNDRDGPTDCGNLLGQFIGPAQVPAEERNGKPLHLIHHNHGRVCGFAPYIRSDSPDGNARRPYKNQGVPRLKMFLRPAVQCPALITTDSLTVQRPGQPLRQGLTLFGERNQVNHGCPSRKPVVKDGS